MRELSKEETDRLFAVITSNGCREMEETRFHQAVNEAIRISSRLDWQKERPNEPCVFITRVWNDKLKMYDYDIYRFEKIDNGDGEYLAWLTKDCEEFGNINDCNFDEYFIIENKAI